MTDNAKLAEQLRVAMHSRLQVSWETIGNAATALERAARIEAALREVVDAVCEDRMSDRTESAVDAAREALR